MCLIDVHHKLRSGHGIPDAVNRIQAIAIRCSIHVRVEPEYAGLCRKMSKISAECLHVSNRAIKQSEGISMEYAWQHGAAGLHFMAKPGEDIGSDDSLHKETPGRRRRSGLSAGPP